MKRFPFPPKNILVPADLSKPSLAAVGAAKSLARRWRASLTLVHVEQPMPSVWGVEQGMPLATTGGWWPWADYHEWREAKLRKAVGDFPRAKIRTVIGWPPAELADLARGKASDLVVMGSHGYAGLDRVLFGSLAEAVVRRAQVPVLVVPQGASAPRISRILAPWNGRPYATQALLYARDLAKSLGARLDVLHVAPPSLETRELEPRMRRRLETILGRGRSPRWGMRLLAGEPRSVILAQADPRRCDLLVLAAHRRPLLSDFVMGSTAERALRHARTAVLAIPSVGTKRPAAAALRPGRWLAKEPYIF